MIKALLSLHTDLASSIAVRYTNALSSRMKMIVQDIHVVEPTQAGSEPGSGWVRKTWENALIETAKNEIRHFMEMEKDHTGHLKTPNVLIGDRSEKLLDELRIGDYQLFMEGVLPTLSTSGFSTLLNSRLYRMMPCPALLIKNLVIPDQAALLLDDQATRQAMTPSFLNILLHLDIPIDLIYLSFTKSGDASLEETGTSDAVIEDIRHVLSDKGIRSRAALHLEGPPSKMAETLREYGMVSASLAYQIKRNHPLMELLSFVPSPIMIGRHG